MNLLRETIDTIREHNFVWPEDIAFITAYDYNKGKNVEIPLSLFCEAADHNYDNGYGSAEVDQSLTIVMTSGDYFVRQEYDGAESWEFVPTKIEWPTTIAEEYNPFY